MYIKYYECEVVSLLIKFYSFFFFSFFCTEYMSILTLSKVQESNCKKDDDKNKCFSFPSYPCCEGCDVVEKDSDGSWGIEKDSWCGLKESCQGKDGKGDKDSNITSSKPKGPELEPLTSKFYFFFFFFFLKKKNNHLFINFFKF